MTAAERIPFAAPRPRSRITIDLHAHTVVSDGTLTPTQLVDHAAHLGLLALAITDHDHVGALAEARRAAERHGLEIVTGIELSAEHDGVDVHVLGYLFDDTDAALLDRLETLRESRARRGVAMLEKLREVGIELTPDDLARELGSSTAALGRPHVARALMRKGVVSSVQEAFDRYLGWGRPAYVPKAKLTLAEAIALVHAAGGVASIAHAGVLPEEGRGAILADAIEAGLDAIEVEHPKNEEDVREELRRIAQEHGLATTGGSDFHGDTKPHVKLGQERVERATLDELKRRKRRP